MIADSDTKGETRLTMGTFCSGIGAPEQAAVGLPVTPVFTSEIEPFPCAVLKERHPEATNLGDMTKLHDTEIPSVDVVFAGTPCQSFSVAGLRAGMADPRGNLALVLLGLVDRIRPKWLVWENVPGVLSSLSHEAPDPSPPPPPVDMECDGQEVVTEDEYSAEELHALNCFVAGLAELGYGWAMRVLDAQYFGVPQRRRRVFVVGHLGDWRRAAAVLFERHCLSGDYPPSRETGERVAGTLAARTKGGGGLGTDFDCHGGLVGCLSDGAHYGGGRTGKTHIQTELSRCLNAGGMGRQDYETETLIPTGGFFDNVSHSLRADGFDASEDGTGRGTPIVPVAFAQNTRDEVRQVGGDGQLVGALGADVGMKQQTYVAYSSTTCIATPMAVRRLTPTECERLQGFPDNYTAIQFRNKPAKDGPRYKALGNSMAVPVVRWILERILASEAA